MRKNDRLYGDGASDYKTDDPAHEGGQEMELVDVDTSKNNNVSDNKIVPDTESALKTHS